MVVKQQQQQPPPKQKDHPVRLLHCSHRDDTGSYPGNGGSNISNKSDTSSSTVKGVGEVYEGNNSNNSNKNSRRYHRSHSNDSIRTSTMGFNQQQQQPQHKKVWSSSASPYVSVRHETDWNRCDSGDNNERGRTTTTTTTRQLLQGRHYGVSPQLTGKFGMRRSTEDLFRSHETNGSGEQQEVGLYGFLRRKLDYKYHTHYRKERQWLHDSIIHDVLENNSSSSSSFAGVTSNSRSSVGINKEQQQNVSIDPWLMILAGAQGAGKRHVFRQLMEERHLPLHAAVYVDPDEIRRCLPEYDSYLEDSPRLLNVWTQKECDYISETLVRAALKAGRNVALDTCLKDRSWYTHLIYRLRQDHPHLKAAMIHVTAPLHCILKRGHLRALETGRDVPWEEIQLAEKMVPHMSDAVRMNLDYFCIINNSNTNSNTNDGPIELVETNDQGPNPTWEAFSKVFDQVSEHVPALRRFTLNDKDDENQDMAAAAAAAAAATPTAAPSLLRQRSLRRFNALRSSEDNHRANHMNFYGQYSHIRATLDYSYHNNYTFARQIFQDAIINEFMGTTVIKDRNGMICTTPMEPWIVFTAGAMGAGKSYTIQRLVDAGRFPLLAFVRVDPDEIRRYLPEFHVYVRQSPELAGKLTNKEAGYIAELLTKAAMCSGKNVLVDGSLRDSGWYAKYFSQLRKDFPGIRLALIHVTAPREAIFQRAAERAISTGRIVPREVLMQALDEVPRSVEKLSPLVDFAVELHNAPNAPDIELRTPGVTWDSFEHNWIQTCAWVPKNTTSIQRQSAQSSEHEEKSEKSSSNSSGTSLSA